MTELWLVRHGETEWSALGRHTGRTDIPLTVKGREQAAELGRFLARTKFHAVFCSPLLRSRETCEIAGLGGVAVDDEGLREWDYGIYEGRTTPEIQAETPGWSVWKDAIAGGESVQQVGERADGVIARALAAGSGAAGWQAARSAVAEPAVTEPAAAGSAAVGLKANEAVRIALFSHAHLLRILAARWVGLAARDGSLLTLSTGSISVLGWEHETRVIARWNRGFEQ